jgi:RNA polymerase sigma-70 factor (ECF subfamily)
MDRLPRPRQRVSEPPANLDGAGGDLASAEFGAAVERAQRGDEDAFRHLYRTVQPGLLRYLRGIVAQDAEDVASDAWSQIARDLGTFRGDGRDFRGWAATIARNRALDHLRYQRRRPVSASLSLEELTDHPAHDDTAGSALELVSTAEAIAIIAALPRDQAEAVLLRVVMGLDVATTARVLGKRAGAVRTAAHRGLRRLSDQLADGYRANHAAVPRATDPRPAPDVMGGERRARA